MGSSKKKVQCKCQVNARRYTKTSKPRSNDPSEFYKCRVCPQTHPLKKCGKFLAMNIAKRLEAVRKHRYCVNCLAHKHDEGSCASKMRCKQCKKFHHSLLHVNPRLRKELLSDKPSPRSQYQPDPLEQPSSSKQRVKESTLSSLVRSNEVILLPTACAQIVLPNGKRYNVRCLINTGMAHSKIHTTLVEKQHIMRYSLDKETLCPLKLKSIYDEHSFLEHTFRVDDIDICTPTESLSPSFKMNYRNISLADSKFYISDGIDIILGMDVYKKVIIPGDISKPGLPDATNTIFGYSINGSYAA